jgi:hypothetical protein
VQHAAFGTNIERRRPGRFGGCPKDCRGELQILRLDSRIQISNLGFTFFAHPFGLVLRFRCAFGPIIEHCPNTCFPFHGVTRAGPDGLRAFPGGGTRTRIHILSSHCCGEGMQTRTPLFPSELFAPPSIPFHSTSYRSTIAAAAAAAAVTCRARLLFGRFREHQRNLGVSEHCGAAPRRATAWCLGAALRCSTALHVCSSLAASRQCRAAQWFASTASFVAICWCTSAEF